MEIEDAIFNLVDRLISTNDAVQHQAILDQIDVIGPSNVLRFLSLIDRHRFDDYPESLRLSSKSFRDLIFFEGFSLQRYKLSLLLLTKIADERNIEIWNALRIGGKFSNFISTSLYVNAMEKALETYDQLIIDDLNKFISNIPTEEETIAKCKTEEDSLLVGGNST